MERISWKNAWDEYARGNVASETAVRLIERSLINTMTSSAKVMEDSQSEADGSEDDTEIPPQKIPSQKNEELLQSDTKAESSHTQLMASLDAMGTASRKGPSQKKGRQLHFQHSHRIGERLWKTAESEIKADMRHKPGHMFQDSWQDHLPAISIKDV